MGCDCTRDIRKALLRAILLHRQVPQHAWPTSSRHSTYALPDTKPAPMLSLHGPGRPHDPLHAQWSREAKFFTGRFFSPHSALCQQHGYLARAENGALDLKHLSWTKFRMGSVPASNDIAAIAVHDTCCILTGFQEPTRAWVGRCHQ